MERLTDAWNKLFQRRSSELHLCPHRFEAIRLLVPLYSAWQSLFSVGRDGGYGWMRQLALWGDRGIVCPSQSSSPPAHHLGQVSGLSGLSGPRF